MIMNENKSLSQRTMQGFVWKFLEKIGSQGMQLIIQIILARILLPEEYGLIGLLSIFITVSDVFILQGLTTALIREKDADNRDYSSVFFANIVLSLVLYMVLYAIAPVVSRFYDEPLLVNLMRVLSLNVIIGAIPAVHNAILARNLDFKKSFYRNILNTLTQGAVGISLACGGFGAWSMVFSKLSGTLVGAIVLCVTVKWGPKKIFDFKRIKHLFSYSSKVLVTNLLNTIFNNIHSLIIGRYFSTADVGYYQRGQQTPQVLMSSIDGSMAEVLYPSFAKIQNDTEKLKKAVRYSVCTSMYVVIPVLLGLYTIAEPLTLLILTEKWLPSVPFMKLSCIVCMFWPLAHRSHAINAIGRSDITLRISIIGKILTIISIVVCIKFGIYALMLGTIAASVISVFVESYYVKKILGYSFYELLQDVGPSFGLALIMSFIVNIIGRVDLAYIIVLCLQIIIGIVFYIAGSFFFKLKGFEAILMQLKSFVIMRKKNA